MKTLDDVRNTTSSELDLRLFPMICGLLPGAYDFLFDFLEGDGGTGVTGTSCALSSKPESRAVSSETVPAGPGILRYKELFSQLPFNHLLAFVPQEKLKEKFAARLGFSGKRGARAAVRCNAWQGRSASKFLPNNKSSEFRLPCGGGTERA